MRNLMLGLALIWTVNASALTHKDYYCAERLLAPVVTYALQAKDCGGDKKPVEETLCTEAVNCVALTEESKTRAAKLAGKEKYAEMTEAEKYEHFKSLSNLDWFPSTLTCAQVKGADGKMRCPLPSACKGDFLFKAKIIDFNEIESLNEYNARLAEQKPEVFEPLQKPNAGAAK